jgi:hypothetical protein
LRSELVSGGDHRDHRRRSDPPFRRLGRSRLPRRGRR